MSEIAPVVATFAPSATPSVEAAPAPEPKPERILQGRAALRAKLTKAGSAVLDSAVASTKFKDESPAVSSETPNQETAEAVADLTKAGVEESKLEKKPGETQARYETRIAQLILSNQRTEAESLKHKTNFEKVSAERDELKARLTEASSDPVKALKLANMTPDEMAQAMLEGKLSKAEEKIVKQEMDPELKALLEEAKAFKAEKQAAAEAAEAAKVREGNIKIIENAKKNVVAEYPVLDLIPNDRLLDAYEQIAKATGEEPDFAEFAGRMQQNVVSEVAAAVAHVGTFRALLKEKPELKAFLLKELGASTSDPTSITLTPTTPTKSTIAGTPSETPIRKKDMSMAERKARAAQAADKVFSNG